MNAVIAEAIDHTLHAVVDAAITCRAHIVELRRFPVDGRCKLVELSSRVPPMGRN